MDAKMRKQMAAKANQPDKLVFLHIDTPNPHNDSICYIEVLSTDRTGNATEEFASLINPECEFRAGFSKYHGIYPEDVVDAYTLDEAWKDHLRDIFDGARIIVRNPTFSMHTFAKALAKYGIVPEPMRVRRAPSREYERDRWWFAYEEGKADWYQDPNEVNETERCRHSFFLDEECQNSLDCPTEEHDVHHWDCYDFSERKFAHYSWRLGCWKC